MTATNPENNTSPDTSTRNSPEPVPAVPNVLHLSRSVLTLSLIAVALIPVALATTVWLTIPSTPEPLLPAEVTMEPVPWPPQGDDVKLMPGVRVHNPSDQAWTNVSMAINKQFYFYSPDPITAGGDLRVPLAFFKTSGNQPYRPTVVPMRLLTVYAQQPSGQRAILDVKY